MNVTKQDLDEAREALMEARMEYDRLQTRYVVLKELTAEQMREAALVAYAETGGMDAKEFINDYYNQGETNT